MISRSLPSDAHVPAAKIRDVGVIFKTHLDLGFTDMAAAVSRRYMEDFLPRAVQMALESENEADSFVWTTGSWLVEKYLNHARGRALRDFEKTLERGLIRWHALPFTFQSEALDEDLLASALRISKRLDERFGTRTRAAKMTDVPGHTRGIIPALASAGVHFLHIGINPASKVPQVPRLFRWRHPEGKEIVVCCDGTYGGYCPVPGHGKLFALAMTGDNAGPPGRETVRNTYRDLRAQFPRAAIHATTLEELAAAAWKIRTKLPVVTSEIGDTWIHGYGSDPWKMGAYRALAAARRKWTRTGELDPESKAGRRFDECLLLSMEHTWGLDEKTWMCDGQPLSKITSAYRKEEFVKARKLSAFKKMESSWAEQREYLQEAVKALPTNTLRRDAAALLEEPRPAKPSTTRAAKSVPRASIKTHIGSSLCQLDSDGSYLMDRLGKTWLARLSYEVYGGAAYDKYLLSYVNKEERYGIWAPYDFAKPGCGKVLAQNRRWSPKIVSCHQISPDHALLKLTFPKEATQKFGAPALVEVETKQTEENKLSYELRWFDKPACRMGEALWFSFRLPVPSQSQWQLHKLGGPVDPLDVVPRGNRHLHIVQHGVEVVTPNGDRWLVDSPDAALVSPGNFPLVSYSNRQPAPSRDGFAFNLFNNTWGTNFPMWYEDNARFRFEVTYRPAHAKKSRRQLR